MRIRPRPTHGLERLPHVVVVGGGFAGLNAARQLAKKRVTLTLIDRRNHHLFQPLLYQVATAALSPANISWPIRNVFRRQRNVEVLLAEVVGFDLDQKLVLLDGDEAVGYDYLIIASGATHHYFGNDHWAQVAPGLKTLEDAVQIRRQILMCFERAERSYDPEVHRRLLSFVVVGGGPTGIELAGAISELALDAIRRDFRAVKPEHARVLLVEAGERILPGFPETLSEQAKRDLESMGVEVWTNSMVTDIAPGKLTIGEQEIAAETILWAAGVQASGLGAKLGVELDKTGRVAVADDLSIPGHQEVFVAGDLALIHNKDGSQVPGVAPAALQMGATAAQAIGARIEGREPRPFRYFDKGSLATIGRSRAVADFGRARFRGSFAWLLWGIVHVFFLVSFRNRILVTLQWLWQFVTYQRGGRLITGLPGRFAPKQRSESSSAS